MKDGYNVPRRGKIAYGLGDLGINVAYGAIGFYFVFFLTDVAGMTPLWAGYIFMIARIWNALADSITGMISDKTKSRFGRRKPYLLFGAIPLGICFSLLWLVPLKNNAHLFIYYTFVGILFNTIFSFVAIPYNALLPELTQNYDERTSIAGYKMGLSFVGTLLSAMGVMLIVDTIFPGKSDYLTSFPMMGRILGVVIIINILTAFLGTKERVVQDQIIKKEKFAVTVKSIFNLKEFKIIVGIFLFNMISFDIIMAMDVYFMKYVVNISEDLTFVLMAIPLVIAVVSTPIWVRISELVGKQKAYIISAAYFMLPLALCLFVPPNNLPFVILIVGLMGIGISASQVLTFSILPDIVEVDEYKNGVRREGAIYGIIMFLYKLASAITIALVSALLGLFGYIQSGSGSKIIQPASAILGIRILIGILPAVCIIISAIFVKKLSINKEVFDSMKQKIETRKIEI